MTAEGGTSGTAYSGWSSFSAIRAAAGFAAATITGIRSSGTRLEGDGEQDRYDEHEERARRTEALQRAESEFDAIPFDSEAARIYRARRGRLARQSSCGCSISWARYSSSPSLPTRPSCVSR